MPQLENAKRSMRTGNEAPGDPTSCVFDGDCWRDVIVIGVLINLILRIKIVLRGPEFGS